MKLYQHISVNTIYGRAVILQQILRQGGVREPHSAMGQNQLSSDRGERGANVHEARRWNLVEVWKL